MKFHIKRCNIAAAIEVTTGPDTYFCVGGTPGKFQSEAYLNNNMARNVWDELPLKVRAAVNRDFGIVFSLPVNAREDLIRNSIPYTLDLSGEDL